MLTCVKLPEDVAVVVEQLELLFSDIVFTGSQVIGGAKPDSDYDFVVACSESELAFKRLPEPDTKGHVSCEGKPNISTFRFGRVNLIVDHRGDQILDNWRIATDYCIEHGLTDKPKRIEAFEMLGT